MQDFIVSAICEGDTVIARAAKKNLSFKEKIGVPQKKKLLFTLCLAFIYWVEGKKEGDTNMKKGR